MSTHHHAFDQLDPATFAVQAMVNASNELAARQARRLGVTVTDLRALYLLQAVGPLGAAELSRRLGLSANAITSLVDRLVDSGQVVRETDPSDRRRILVRILDAARERSVAEWMPIIQALDGVARALTPEDRNVVVGFLAEIRAVMESLAR